MASERLVYIINKKKLTRWLEGMNFIFSFQKQYFTHSLRSLVKYCLYDWKIKFVSSRRCVLNIFYILLAIKNCEKIFLKIILRLKNFAKNDDVSTLAKRHYQVKTCSIAAVYILFECDILTHGSWHKNCSNHSSCYKRAEPKLELKNFSQEGSYPGTK